METSSNLLIGLNGFKGCGKDTVGSILVEEYGFTRYAFADKLKQAVAALWGIPVHWVDEYKDEEARSYVALHAGERDDLGMTTKSSMSWRKFLQRFGTEMGRDIFGTNFWVDQVLPYKELFTAKYDNNYHGNRVFTDARFANELERIKDLDGMNINITRPHFHGEGHASEEAQPDWLIDYRIDNNGTIEDLRVKVREFINQVPTLRLDFA